MKRYGKQKILLLITIMTVIVMAVTSISLSLRYNQTFDQIRDRLIETAQSQAHLMGAIARFDNRHRQNDVEGGARAASLGQILDAYEKRERVSKTSEFTLAQKQDEQIVFLIPHPSAHNSQTASPPISIPIAGTLAEPMRRALSGKSGSAIAIDYMGKTVLAAYEPVQALGLGIVAKIELAEIRAPFIKDGIITSAIALVLILLGSYLFLRVSSPIIRRMEGSTRKLHALNENLEQRIRERTSELSESNKKYAAIVEQAEDCIISIDKEQRITLFNPAAEKVFEYSAEEILGTHLNTLIPERYRDRHLAIVARFGDHEESTVVKRKKGMFGLRKNGEEFPIETSFSKQPMGDSHLITVTLRDISQRVKSEEQLRKLSQAIQEAGEAVLITDRDGEIEYVNPAFTNITGYQPEEAIGNTPAMLKSSAQDPSFYKDLWDTITAGEVWHGTLIDRRKGGGFFPALMSIAPIHNEDGEITHFVAIQQDMTEYKKMEDQFLQAQKMEAIGTLVGGIAHDFNNILAAMQGNVYLAKQKTRNQPELDDKLDNVELLGTRAAEMVKQLLTFARKDRVELRALSLNSFINEGFKLVRTAIPENINFVYDLCQEELIIHGDATQLQQVLMNLLNNARDAVSHVSHPTIHFSLKPFVATDDFVKRHPDIKGGRFAELIIGDNGSGISEIHINKVFEPFFTTKEVGEGTGLGLAMVYGAVQSHGGIIEVEGGKGTDTAFHVYLPLTEEAANSLQESETTAIQGRGETILLVDDEESIRDTTGEVLNSLGYKVLRAGDGEQALQIFMAHQDDISLLITDIVMPNMGGINLAKSARLLNKKVPIIFATGYARDKAMSAGDQIEKSIVIGKPFQIAKLSQMIRKLIDSN